jgi:hypothetical protein
VLSISGDMRRRYGDEAGQLRTLAFLVEGCGADVNYRNAKGMTPLATAARAGYRDIVDYLLSKGADPSPDAPEWADQPLWPNTAATKISLNCFGIELEKTWSPLAGSPGANEGPMRPFLKRWESAAPSVTAPPECPAGC